MAARRFLYKYTFGFSEASLSNEAVHIGSTPEPNNRPDGEHDACLLGDFGHMDPVAAILHNLLRSMQIYIALAR